MSPLIYFEIGAYINIVLEFLKKIKEGRQTMNIKNNKLLKSVLLSLVVIGGLSAKVAEADASARVEWSDFQEAGYYESAKLASVARLTDGRLVAVGKWGYDYSTLPPNQYLGDDGYRAIIAIYNSEGQRTLYKLFAGSYGKGTHLNGVAATSDGGFIAVGKSSATDGDLAGVSNKGGFDAIIAKFDANGTKQWVKSFGGNDSDQFNSVYPTPDGGYIAVGASYSTNGDLAGLSKGSLDATIVKFDGSGNVQWKKTFGGSQIDEFRSVAVHSDGSIVASGISYSNDIDMSGLSKGSGDAILVKHDQSGNILWKKSFGGSLYDYFQSVVINADGSIFAAGYSNSTNGDLSDVTRENNSYKDGIIVKYDASGNALWKKSPDVGYYYDYYQAVQATLDGGAIVAGYSEYFNGSNTALDGVLVKLDSGGNTQWNYQYYSCLQKYKTPNCNETFNSVAVSSDGHFVAVGDYNKNYLIVNFEEQIPLTPATFSADVTTPTNGNVTVTITYPAQAVVKQYKIDNGNWTTYTSPIVMTSNGTIYARSQDAAGNWSPESSYVVNNIDKVAPATPTLSANPSTPTNGNVTVTITYPADAVTKQYKIGSAGTWTNYTAPVVLTDNNTVYARAIDAAGNVSNEGSLVVSNIDKVAPTAPVINVNGNKLTITPGTDASGIQKTEYRLNGGAWTTYTSVVTLPDGNYTIDARSIDNAGNVSNITTVTAQVYVQALQNAINAVVQAETSKLQSDVDFARQLVNNLPDGADKNNLNQRLDLVQAEIDRYNAIRNEINTMDNNINQGNVTLEMIPSYKKRVGELRNEVNVLPDPFDKAGLHAQLDEINKKLLLLESVLKAGNGDLKDVDLDDLQEQIDQLPDGGLKDQLQEQLDRARDIQDAIQKVERAEQTRKQKDKDIAQEAVNKLPDGNIKQELQERLDAIVVEDDGLAKQIADAERKVRLAELYKREPYIGNAQAAVDALPDGEAKDALQARLDALRQALEQEQFDKLLREAERKVELAERYKREPYISNAQQAVDALPDGDAKDALQARLDALRPNHDDGGESDEPPVIDDPSSIGEAIEKIKDPAIREDFRRIVKAVERAEKYFSRANIVYALDLLNAVPQAVQTNPLYAPIFDNLNSRALALKESFNASVENKALEQAIKKAENAVELFERFRTAKLKEQAQQAVDAITDDTVKALLQARIDQVEVKN